MASSLQLETQAAWSSRHCSAAGRVRKVSWKDLQYPPGSIGHRKPKPPPEEIDRELQMDYLTKILNSNVYDVAVETPMQRAPILSAKMGNNLWLKREDTQEIFSFKIRGSYNMISRLSKEKLEKGIICSSAGNHAQGVALAARRLKARAVVVMPKSTPQIKIDAVKRLGGEVELWGNGMADATARAKQRSADETLEFIAPDDHYIIAGQGSIGVEISRQMRDKIHAIFVPIGSGGLVSGLASYYKLIFPEVLVFGVQPNDSNAMAQALCRGEIVNVTDVGDFAEGVALAQVSKETYRICWELLDDVIIVDKHAISRAIKDMFNDERSILETSGALSIAAAQAYCEYNNIKGQNVVAVTSGANINFDELGHIADYANADQSIVLTKLPDRPGSFQELIELLADYVIVEMTYRASHDSQQGIVIYKIKAVGYALDELLDNLNAEGFDSFNLSDDEIVIDHLSHMAGGIINLEIENLYRFSLPEKKGSLRHFFRGFRQDWKLTLFHYRYQGVISSSVLVGVELEKAPDEQAVGLELAKASSEQAVGLELEKASDEQAVGLELEKASDEQAFHHHLKKVGYRFETVAMKPGLRDLLKL